jgi:hypothetical protein
MHAKQTEHAAAVGPTVLRKPVITITNSIHCYFVHKSCKRCGLIHGDAASFPHQSWTRLDPSCASFSNPAAL